MTKYAVFWIYSSGETNTDTIEGVKARNNFLNTLKADDNVVYVYYQKILGSDDHDVSIIVKDTVVINNKMDAYRFMGKLFRPINLDSYN